MKPEEKRPLVTLALFTYNQEGLVAAAMEAALAQDYDPLEIIVSDDCSSDGTWDVINGIAGTYAGPHVLRPRRNETNLGAGTHVGHVGMLASGELVVVAAGDDISSPERVTRLVEAWNAAGRPPGLVHSSMRRWTSDRHGVNRRPRGYDPAMSLQQHVSRIPFIHGCTAAYSKEVFREFPPLEAAFEDSPLTLRSLLMGQLVYVDLPLVDYFATDASLTRPLRITERKRTRAHFQALKRNIECMERDYRFHVHRSGGSPDPLVEREFSKQRESIEIRAGLGSRNPLKLIRALLFIPRNGTLKARLGFYLTFLGLWRPDVRSRKAKASRT